jgi:RHS repeat-associated protein
VRTSFARDGEHALHEWEEAAEVVQVHAPPGEDAQAKALRELSRMLPPEQVAARREEKLAKRRLGRGEACSIVADQVGAPLVVLGEGGEVKAQLVLDSRGRATIDGDESVCPWRFAGQYRDDETGLHYNRFRYYDADAGQYISRDPLGLRAGLRVYGYVGDPGVAGDPLGLAPQAGEGCGGKGAKRGPKPWPEGAHNETIERRIAELEAEGHVLVAGGPLKEEVVDIESGHKTARRPDITTIAPDGTIHRENVGRTNASGEPVRREREALDDLEQETGTRPVFTPYDR